MSSPRLLLIDEPSVGLSPLLVSQTIAKIGELNERFGLTVLMAEQNFNQAIRIADRGYIIVHGEIVVAAAFGRRVEGQRHRQAALSRRYRMSAKKPWYRSFCPRRSSAAIRSRIGWSTASCCRRAWRACASICGACREPWLEQAQDDATLLAIRDMERAGIDIITDGEMRRESYSNRFATSLEGIECGKPGQVVSKAGLATAVPRVVGRIRRTRPVEVRDMEFLRRNTERHGEDHAAGSVHDEPAGGQRALCATPDEMVMDYAAAVNAEARDLEKAGADVIQLDEPWLRQDPTAAKRIAVKAINRALEGITVTTVVHLCFGYAAVVAGQKPVGYSFLTELAACAADQISIEAAQPKLDLGVLKDLAPKKIMLGVIDLADPAPETPAMVADRIRAALKHVAPERLVPAPDCGMKYLPRELAFAKLKALADGAALVRAELS